MYVLVLFPTAATSRNHSAMIVRCILDIYKYILQCVAVYCSLREVGGWGRVPFSRI